MRGYKQKGIKLSQLNNIGEKEGRVFRIVYSRQDEPLYRYEKVFKNKKNLRNLLNTLKMQSVKLYVLDLEEQE